MKTCILLLLHDCYKGGALKLVDYASISLAEIQLLFSQLTAKLLSEVLPGGMHSILPQITSDGMW